MLADFSTGLKICGCCKTELPIAAFSKTKGEKDGLQNACDQCQKKRKAAWYQRTIEVRRAKIRDSYQKNIEARRKYGREYSSRNRKSITEYMRGWRSRNRENVAYMNGQCSAVSRMATPRWANKFFMLEIYRLAIQRSQLLGKDYEVDHIVPLNSKLVCGLHCEQNLQIIPAEENYSKGNRRWPDMP